MRNLVLYHSNGTRQTPSDEGVYTLANATTYYAELYDDIEDRVGFSVHYEWDAALVAAITVEASNMPKRTTLAYSSTGWRATTAPTISAAALASGAIFVGTGYTPARGRIKVAVTTGGTLQAFEHSKDRGAR